MAVPSLQKRRALTSIAVAVGTLLLVGTAARAESIDDAVAHVKEMVKSGASRFEIGQWVTKTLDERIKNLNSPWEGYVVGASEDEKKEFRKWRDQGVFSYDRAAKWAWEQRVGQCEEQACSAYYILKEAGVPGRLQIVGTKSHAFVVWGMAENADVSDEKTWGRDAIIVDGWLGSTSKLRLETRTRTGPTLFLGHTIYWGQKWDFTPAFAGNLVIGGPWDLVIDWKNVKTRQDKTPIESKVIIKQIGDSFDGVISKGELKVTLAEGRIHENGLIRFQWSFGGAEGQIGGVGLFQFTDEEAKLVKGRYTTKIVYEGTVFATIVPFTGEVDARTITLFPQDPIVNAQ